MVTSIAIYASLEMDSLITRTKGDATDRAAGVGDGGVAKVGDKWVGNEVDDGLMVWRADVVGAQGSFKQCAYWTSTLPAGGCNKLSEQGGRTSHPLTVALSGHLPELQGSTAEAQANTLSSFTGRADRHPPTGPVSFWRQLVRNLRLTQRISSARIPIDSRSTAAKSLNTIHHGFHQWDSLR